MIEIVIWVLYAVILYISIFSLLVFLEKGELRQEVEWLDEWPTVSIIIPAYNEEDSIGMTLESVLGLNYPEDKLEAIVVDDGSEDSTSEVVSRYTDNENIKLIRQENQGKGGALNTGIDEAEGEFVACADADSLLDSDSIKNMVSRFDEDTAAVASAMKVYKPENMLQEIQWIEYIVGIFMRNIMELMNAIFVTPGPLSIYRKNVIQDLGGFDEDCLVEDQEICFRLQKHHWKVAHSRTGEVYTIAPKTISEYYNQRKRWYMGSARNIMRYKEMMLNSEYGDFGMFGIPSQVASAALSIVTLFIMSYLTLKPIASILSDVAEIGLPALIPSDLTLGTWEILTSIYWSLLGLRFIDMLLLGSLFFVSFFIAYLAVRHTDEKLTEHGYIAPFVYLAFYVVFLGFMWLVVLVEMVFDTEVTW